MGLLSTLNLQSSTSLAQGTAFTYQGRLEVGGAPASGIYDLTFTLQADDNGPAPVGAALTRLSVPVSNGLFSVTLDFGSDAFTGAARWLDIAVRTNGGGGAYTNLSPRQRITATPYAVTAGNLSGTISAGQVSGVIPLAQLPAAVVTNNQSGVNFTGTFAGSGAGLTAVNLALNSGGAMTWHGNFVLASSLGVGSSPRSVTAADVNGDGRPDLISANRGAGTLTVLTNNGSGGFVLASSPGVGSAPHSVTAADVNGDGKPDLISANSAAATLTVLTNNGSGGFLLASSPGVGPSPLSVTSADVNGDGKPDMVSANYGVGTLTVLTNNGSGGFVLASSPGAGPEPYSVTPADVNGDGKPDLISANTSASTLTVLFNAPTFTGTFAGNGSGLTSLRADHLSGAVPPATLTSVPAGSLTGTIANARLSANVALRDASQTFTSPNNFNASVTINPPASLSFGSQTRQMINLWSTDYALGVQGGAGYFRSGGDFHWYLGGSHSDANGNAGSGGVPLMSLKSSGRLGLGITNPDYPLDVQSGLAVGRFTTTNNANGAVLSLRNNTASPTYLGAINFEDSGTPGQIAYLASGQMTFRVAGADRMNLQAGGLYVNGALVLTSDRNAKEDFVAVNAQEVLAKVAALPLQSWSYTNRPGVKHVGPMAQDFRAAFGLGEDDKHIATVDADGVALAAIQGLNQKLERENAELKARLEKLEQRLNNQLNQNAK